VPSRRSRRLGERRSQSFVEPPFGAGRTKHRGELYREQTQPGQNSNVKTYLLIPLVALAAAGCGQSSPRSTAAQAPKAPAAGGSGTEMTQQCATSELEVWLGVGEGAGAAGSTYYPLELTNISSRRCRLFGFPGVSAIAGHQLGSPAQRNRAHHTYHVTLLPGATAHTVLQISDVGNFSPGACKPAEASGLRVYPPGQFAAAEVPFGFRACSSKAPIFLSVEPIQPGLGVPGQ
jgi:Protein of unknown function (DUF4232)